MKTLTTVLFSTLILCSSSLFAAEHKVDIKNMAFSPATLNVEAGDTVIFTNRDSIPHTGTAKDKSFDTGILSQGQSGTVKVAAAGKFDYFCAIHPSMTGKITAKSPAPAANGSGSEGSSGGSTY